MKKKSVYLLSVPLIALVAALAMGAASERTQTFEYKVVWASANEENQLGKLGAEGWELVAVTPKDSVVLFYLKRPASK